MPHGSSGYADALTKAAESSGTPAELMEPSSAIWRAYDKCRAVRASSIYTLEMSDQEIRSLGL